MINFSFSAAHIVFSLMNFCPKTDLFSWQGNYIPTFQNNLHMVLICALVISVKRLYLQSHNTVSCTIFHRGTVINSEGHMKLKDCLQLYLVLLFKNSLKYISEPNEEMLHCKLV